MGLPNVIFNRTQGGLGRALPNSDHVSGMLFFSDTLPSGFTSSNRINKFFNLKDAESRGIVDTQADETKATGGNVEITTPGAAGIVNKITLDGALLGSYTVITSDTNDLVATGLRAAINALTYKHGFSAAGTGANVLLTAPAGCGKAINTGNATLAFSSTGAGAATVTQFSGGVGSQFAVMHYHISEYFRMQPKGVLYVGIYAVATYTGAQIQTMQNYANGEIRQLAVYLPEETFATSHLTASQTYATLLRAAHKPLTVLFTADLYASSLASLTDLGLLTCPDVSMNIAEDGNFVQPDYDNTKTYVAGDKVNWAGNVYIAKGVSTGNAPYESTYWTELVVNLRDVTHLSISTIGNELGATSLAKVHENIGWPEKFQLNSGNILDVAGFATGVLYNDQADTLLDTLNDYHYTFTRKFVGKEGTYYNDGWTAAPATNDYCTKENNRTMDKAERGVYAAAVAKLLSPLYVNSDGTLTEDTIAVFKNVCEQPLNQMAVDGELSQFRVTINPAQDVLTTSTIIITIENVPVGVARNIQINSGFTTQIV